MYKHTSRVKGCFVFFSLCAVFLQSCGFTETAVTQKHAPLLLSQTGLYKNIQTGTLRQQVQEFTPQYPLWTDGATKRRWIYLPPSRSINTSDMNTWIFPIGTKLWKEFTRDGVRVETRLLHKIGNNGIQDWVAVSYIWNRSQTDATRSIPERSNQLGTQHDVPSAGQCISCHGGRKSVVLGFSAIQLSHTKSSTTLNTLIQNKLISHPPARRIQLPGNTVAQSALGYLHANCGHCHNKDNKNQWDNPTHDNTFRFFLTVDSLHSVRDTDTFKSIHKARNFWGALLLNPTHPKESYLYKVMNREGEAMPPLGTEKADPQGLKMIEDWIRQISP